MPENGNKGEKLKELDLEKHGDLLVPTRVYGKDKPITLKELVTIGQKQVAADQRFQELASKEEELQLAKGVYEDLRAGKDGDTARLARGLTQAGFDAETVKGLMYGSSAFTEESLGDNEELEGEGATNAPKLTMDDVVAAIKQSDLGKQVAQMHSAYTGNQRAVQRSQKQQDIRKALDSHPELAIIMESATPERQQVLQEMAETAVARRLSDFREWGPRPIAAGLADLPAKLKAVGISADSPVPRSLGDAEPSKSGVHLTPDAKALIGGVKDNEHVSVYDPDYSKAILADIAGHLED